MGSLELPCVHTVYIYISGSLTVIKLYTETGMGGM